jgi:DNA-binding transcriptional ArsR family regulator
MAIVELFRALGDPTRLEMVQRLSNGSSQTIGSVSNGLEISRQGARKHLQILADANIVTLHPKGRDTIVTIDLNTLDQAKNFISELEMRWDQRLEALRDFVEND